MAPPTRTPPARWIEEGLRALAAGGPDAVRVEAHVSAVLRKLQLSNRHELSRWAIERRLD